MAHAILPGGGHRLRLGIEPELAEQGQLRQHVAGQVDVEEPGKMSGFS